MFMDYNISSQYNIFDMWKIENLYFKHMFSERYSNHCQYVHVYIRYNKTSNHVLNTEFSYIDIYIYINRSSVSLVKVNSSYMKHKVWPCQPCCTG